MPKKPKINLHISVFERLQAEADSLRIPLQQLIDLKLETPRFSVERQKREEAESALRRIQNARTQCLTDSEVARRLWNDLEMPSKGDLKHIVLGDYRLSVRELFPAVAHAQEELKRIRNAAFDEFNAVIDRIFEHWTVTPYPDFDAGLAEASAARIKLNDTILQSFEQVPNLV